MRRRQGALHPDAAAALAEIMLPVSKAVVDKTISVARSKADGTTAAVEAPLLFTAVTAAGAVMVMPMPEVDAGETPKLARIVVWTLVSQTRLTGSFESMEGALGMCVRMAMFLLTAFMDAQSADPGSRPPATNANAQASFVYLRRAFELALRHYSRMKRRAALDDGGIPA